MPHCNIYFYWEQFIRNERNAKLKSVQLFWRSPPQQTQVVMWPSGKNKLPTPDVRC